MTAVAKLIGPTEQGDDVAYLPMGGKRGNLEYVGQHELCVTIDRVLLQQVFQNLAGFRGVAAEEIRAGLTQVLCTLTAGAKRRVEGDVAEQVEGVGVRLLGGLGKVIEADATLGQALDDFGSPHGVGPLRPQCRGVRAQGADGLGGVVGVADDPQLLPVRVNLIDKVRRNLDAARRRSRTSGVPRSAAP